MTSITGRLLDASGAGVAGVTVTTRLVAAAGFLATGGEIVRAAGTTTDADGDWVLTLTPTGALAYPSGAYYVVEAENRRHTITVPDSGTHPIGDVLADVPADRAELGLTITSADARYATQAYVDTETAAEAATRLPLAGGTLTGSLGFESAAGGNTSDSTRRINLESYQRAVNPNHHGEVVRITLKADDAKAMIAWLEDYTGFGPRSVAWIGAHGKSNDGASWHNHISIEVPDETGALQTALEIPFAPFNQANGYGISAANVYVRAVAKLIAGNVPLSVEGAAGANRDLQFGTTDGTNIGGKDIYRRWTIRADSTAEAGGNAGSDFQLVRRDDTGGALGAAVFVRRSNGQVGIATTNPGATLDVGSGSGTVTMRINRGTTSQFATMDFATNSTSRWSLGIRNDTSNDLHFRNAAQSLTGLLIEDRATAPNISLLTSTKSYGGGAGVVFIPNASTAPSTNPAGGGILFVEAGALKWRGSGGTVTTLGPA